VTRATVTVICWLLRITLRVTVWFGWVFSFRYVKRSSLFVIRIPFLAVTVSPPMVTLLPDARACEVLHFRLVCDYDCLVFYLGYEA
jgi:hypothetical protein